MPGLVTIRLKWPNFARNGLVYAVDIQPEMLSAIASKKENLAISNIETILGAEKSVNLPKHSIDKVLMVDVYHEFSFPVEMITSIKNALKPNGLLFLIEYRGEDSNVPIKKIHKMTEKQSVLEMKAAGFTLKENINNLPWQHCMVFEKNEATRKKDFKLNFQKNNYGVKSVLIKNQSSLF